MGVKESYEFIRFIMSINDLSTKEKLDIVKHTKQQLRHMLASHNDSGIEYHSTDKYGENFFTKEFFDEPFSETDKKNYINDHWLSINSPYDCTGKIFTRSIEIFNFNEPNSFGKQAVVYHFMAIDV